MSLETMQPDHTPPAQVRTSTSLGRLTLRFVGLLFLAVTALALVYSR